jgi:membrane protein DedA with SNARE-associated domain
MSRAAAPKPEGASPEEKPRRTMAASVRWFGLSILLFAAILVPFLLLEDRLTGWTDSALSGVRGKPWLGAGLIVGLLAGDVVLPVPSSLVSAFAGGAFGWAKGAVVIWTGMTLGCVIGYALGSSAGRVLAVRVVGEAEMARAHRLFGDIGPAALIVTRAVPVLAEAGALAAGVARMPFLMFFASTALANAGVAAAYAGVGAAAVSSGSFLIAFLGLASIPAIAWAIWRLVGAPRDARTRRSVP